MTPEERAQIYAWLGYWRDKIPENAVSELQNILGPLNQSSKPAGIIFEECIFIGPAPEPFTDWNSWAEVLPLKSVTIKSTA